MDIHSEKIIILDFGSQTTQLIARRIREQKVYSEIHPYSTSLEKIKALKPSGIILSGGPCSVYDDDAPLSDSGVFELGVPVLGICYHTRLHPGCPACEHGFLRFPSIDSTALLPIIPSRDT